MCCLAWLALAWLHEGRKAPRAGRGGARGRRGRRGAGVEEENANVAAGQGNEKPEKMPGAERACGSRRGRAIGDA
eukprot:SAG22_NODE_1647_length_3899_cov_39.380789_2_plen_75_part_00